MKNIFSYRFFSERFYLLSLYGVFGIGCHQEIKVKCKNNILFIVEDDGELEPIMKNGEMVDYGKNTGEFWTVPQPGWEYDEDVQTRFVKNEMMLVIFLLAILIAFPLIF